MKKTVDFEAKIKTNPQSTVLSPPLEERGEQVNVNSGHYAHLQNPKAAHANQLEICSGVHSVLNYAPIKMSENGISLKLNNPFLNWSEPLACAVTEISVHY